MLAGIDRRASARDPTEIAQLTVRALSALSVKAGPAPLAALSGGCAACRFLAAHPSPGWLEAQVAALFVAAGVLALRRRRERY